MGDTSEYFLESVKTEAVCTLYMQILGLNE